MADLKRRIIAVFSAQNKAKGTMASFRRGLDITGRAMKRMAKVGAVMTVAAVAGSAYMIKRQMEAIDVIAKLSDRLGIATEDLVGLQHAASISGVSTEALNKSLDMFVRRLGEMTMGSGEAQRGLEMLGLTTEELIRLSPAEAMGIAADKINRLETQAEKAAAAYFLFGRAGAQLVTMFAVGSEGLREFQREAERLGLTFSRFDAAQIEAANDALTRARATMTGLFRTATIELAPYIEALADKFVDVATSGEGMGANVVNVFEQMSLAAIRFGDVVQGSSAKLKAFHAGALGGAAGMLDILTWMEKYSGGKLVDKIFGTEMTGGPGKKAAEYRQLAAELMEEAGKEAVGTYGQENAVERFYEGLRTEAAGETAKTIPEQYADALRAKIKMIDREIDENERKLTEAKKAAEGEKNIIIAAARERVNAVRHMDFATRTERIQNLEAYVAANQRALDMVLEAEKILQDELEALERGKLAALKQWGSDASDVWLNIDRIAVKSLDGMADALTELCLTGKADFRSLAQSVISDVTRMMIKIQMAAAIMAVFGESAGGGPSFASALLSGLTGGLLGGAGAGPTAAAAEAPYVAAYGAPWTTVQHGGEVLKTGMAVIHKGETYSGVNGNYGRAQIVINNTVSDRVDVEIDEYMQSDQRIIDVTMRAAETDGPYRRSIRGVS